MAQLHLQLVTPERTLLDEQVDSVSLATTDGIITILPHHAALVASLVSGEMITKVAGKYSSLHVSGGFFQGDKGGDVRVLADAAEHDFEIDLARAEKAKVDAEIALREQTFSDEEYAITATQLQRSLSRIHIAKKRGHRRTRITSEGNLQQ